MRHRLKSDHSNCSSDSSNLLFIFKCNLTIYQYIKTCFCSTQIKDFFKSVTHLHHKLCVHSFLPVAARAKQPAHRIRKSTARYSKANIGQIVTVTQTHSTPGCASWPFSIGSRRWKAEWIWHIVMVSALVRVTVGGNSSSPERIRNCFMFRDATWANNAKGALIVV